MIVYFHIEEISRDLITAALIKRKLKNFFVVFGNRLLMKFLKLTKLHKFIDILIIPNVDFLKEIYDSSDQINPNTKIIIMYTECAGSIIDDITRASFHFFGSDFTEKNSRHWIEKIKYYLLWGKDSYEKCLKINFYDKEKYKILGNPRLDNLVIQKNDPGSFKIGIYTRADGINPYDKRDFINTIFKRRKKVHKYFWSEKDEGIDVEDTFYTMISDVRLVFEIIDKLIENKFEIYLRIHPRENRDAWVNLLKLKRKYKNIHFSDIKEPFSSWVSSKSAIIGPPSTIFYECIVNDKKIYSIEEMNNKRKNHLNIISDDVNKINKFIEKPKSVDDFVKKILDFKKKKYHNNNYILSDELKNILNNDINYPETKNYGDNLFKQLNTLSVSKKNILSLVKYIVLNFAVYSYQLTHLLYNLKNFSIKKNNSTFFYITPGLKKYIENLVK